MYVCTFLEHLYKSVFICILLISGQNDPKVPKRKANESDPKVKVLNVGCILHPHSPCKNDNWPCVQTLHVY